MIDDRVFLSAAQLVAGRSPDPVAHVGCVITDAAGNICASGYNAFPPGVKMNEVRRTNRDERLMRTVHAEVAAVLSAQDGLDGCTAYVWRRPPCSSCAGVLICAGITRVVTIAPSPEAEENWGYSFAVMRSMFDEAGVELVEYPR